MKKVRIIKNKTIYFESHYYKSYENEKIIEIDFNDLRGADLQYADLSDAVLDEKEIIRKGKIINKKNFCL